MKNFKLANNVLGGLVFTIAATVYLMTIEPTASFWDCGEFITSAYKLEVGHPPGAPLFMLVGNIFSHLSDASNAAKMVNAMSALASALTILFLFWTITHLTRKLLVRSKEEMTLSQTILILGSGLVGALAYTFSDTFWFSAVEGEVYASSSLFTAVVFWLILKWEDHADAPHADRWLILIAYLMGLSIGVHLLNLLCIPAIVLVYYYKKFPNPTLKGTIYALLVSFVLILIMMYGIVQGLVKVCGWFELFFVNTLKMPYNTGVYVYLLVTAGVLIWGIWGTMQKTVKVFQMKIAFILSVILLGIPFMGSDTILGLIIIAALTIFILWYKNLQIRALNTIFVSLMVIVIGYSTFAMILVRATADTPMNQNNPRDVLTLRGYLAREQYGDRPLLYGRTYVSEEEREIQGQYLVPVKTAGTPVYARAIKSDPNEKDRYEMISDGGKPVFIGETCMFFPRMYSPDPAHVAAYKDWGEITGRQVRYKASYEQGLKTATMPTFAENLRFLFDYQLNFMYWRYFMWNFSGRQNDIQGNGNVMHGNWITGISFLDEPRVGPQDNMPSEIADNKAHNVFYMLPLILGIIGIMFQVLKKGETGIQSFWITFFLFFMTGVAIVLYLNQTPYQPRERDYAYAGSFYAFCIWIGIGVAGVAKLLEKAKLSPMVAASAASIACIFVPLQMASQTWNDHDRSGRYMARDFGSNYLESCEPNAIIFTHGDNDTFPLWYAQEVEGIRTDVRVCNTSYLQTDWYIGQMQRQAYDSPPLPISWEKKDYANNKRAIFRVFDNEKPLSLSQSLSLMKTDDPKSQIEYGDNMLNYIPRNISLNIDSAMIVNNKTLSPKYEPNILKEMNISLADKNMATIVEAMTLEMLHTNNWKRPIYYAITVPGNIYSYLGDYTQKTGLATQVVPLKTSIDDNTNINTEKMYDNVMNKFKWGGLEKPGLYLEETTMKMCKSQRGAIFYELARSLIVEGQNDKALKVVDKCIEVFPEENVPFDFTMQPIVDLYYTLGETEKAKEIAKKVMEDSFKTVDWILRLKPSQRESVISELDLNFRTLYYLIDSSNKNDPEFTKSYSDRFTNYYNLYQSGQKR